MLKVPVPLLFAGLPLLQFLSLESVPICESTLLAVCSFYFLFFFFFALKGEKAIKFYAELESML